MPCGFLDGFQVTFVHAGAARFQMGAQTSARQRRVGKGCPAHNLGEGFARPFGRAKLVVGIEFERDGLGSHARIMHEKFGSVNGFDHNTNSKRVLHACDFPAKSPLQEFCRASFNLNKLFMRSRLHPTIGILMEATPAVLVLAFLLSQAIAAERETGDFNFDGHKDYRVLRESNGKMHFYDHYLFDPKTNKYAHCKELSSLFNPSFDPKIREIHCVWPGGHSGGIFYEEDFAWKNGKLVFLRSIKQDEVDFGDGQPRYVRVTATLEDGKPKIVSIERSRTPNE